jgi:hypothetical protein
MEPQQQPGQLGHNPYDFILNPPKPTAPHPLGGLPLPKVSGHSLAAQIAVLIGGAIIVMIIIAIIISALTGSNLNTTDLINLAAEQAELIQIATVNGSTVTLTSNQELAINTQLTIQTDSNNLLKFLAAQGVKPSPKQLQADSSAATTLQLQNAQANSTIDTVFAQIMQNQLQTYTSSIRKDYDEATNPTLKRLLSTDYTQAELLIKEVPSSASTQS